MEYILGFGDFYLHYTAKINIIVNYMVFGRWVGVGDSGLAITCFLVKMSPQTPGKQAALHQVWFQAGTNLVRSRPVVSIWI
tara:strand:- start:17622 stop:17864 length:243 start_codon:yes stop_codon:yes gene_type:complete